VLGTDRQMFASRSGGTVRLVDLIDEAIARAHREALAKGVDPADAAGIAQVVGVGAIKYADLANDRIKDYVFDLDRMVSFDGNTAGYAQYAHARARSVIRKAGGVAAAPVRLVAPAERALAFALLELPAAVRAVEDSLEPHRLAGYIHGLATTFTAFYDACPVLTAEAESRASRLVLVDMTARVLARALSLLGIEVPETM
jgi:arginyl-tRNA synthetase